MHLRAKARRILASTYLTNPEAKEMMKEKYEAIKLLFNSMKQYT